MNDIEQALPSRPPSYMQPSGSDLGIAAELADYYDERERCNNYFNTLFCFTTHDMPYLHAVKLCILGQFCGLAMVFWTFVFIFLGAVAVFLPNISQAMWIPLVVYLLLCLGLFRSNYVKYRRINKLERQVLQERLARRTLPEDHYFEIKYEQGHIYRTLLKPPPVYNARIMPIT